MPLIHFSFFGKDASGNLIVSAPSTMSSATLSDSEWRSAYKEAVLDVLKIVRPKYLSVGNEVNRWYDEHGADSSNSNGFQYFVSLYEDIYDAVKLRSPGTTVFCVFAREIVSEYREGTNLKTVMGMFDASKLDIVAFTTYAYAVSGINAVSGVPDDYFSKVIPTGLSGKRVAFTELCWTSIAFFGGQQGQVDFLNAVIGRLTTGRSLSLEFIGWPWMHDLDANDESGMLEFSGTAKAVWTTWSNL